MTILEARGLRIVRGRVLVEGLDLRVEDEVVAVQGASGSGKSSLLRALAGLDPVDGGAITLDGQTMAELGPPGWRARVRYVPQGDPGLAGTPTETAAALSAYAPPADRDPVALAEGWGLPAERWTQPWFKLSGGERQRAVLALALCRPSDVLLLDEPTSALDPEAAAAVEASLKGRAAIWVTHDVAQAGRADRVVTL